MGELLENFGIVEKLYGEMTRKKKLSDKHKKQFNERRSKVAKRSKRDRENEERRKRQESKRLSKVRRELREKQRVAPKQHHRNSSATRIGGVVHQAWLPELPEPKAKRCKTQLGVKLADTVLSNPS